MHDFTHAEELRSWPREAFCRPKPAIQRDCGLFGIGWGLVGLCPSPALVNLAGLNVPVILFVTTMAAGMSGYDLWQTGFTKAGRREDALGHAEQWVMSSAGSRTPAHCQPRRPCRPAAYPWPDRSI